MILASRIFAPEPAAASFRLKALVEALAEANADVTVLTTTPPTTNGYRPPAGVRVRRWPALRDKSGYVRGYVPYLSFDLPLALRLLLARRPDVVVVEPPPTTGAVVRVVCALRRIPYVYYAADLWSDAARAAGMHPLVHKALRWLERFAMGGARTLLSVSDQVTERLTAWSLGERTATVGNGIDTSVFTLHGPVQEVAGRVLVYAGTASEVHGAGIFVDAMPDVLAQFPDAHLVFIGHGAEIGQLQQAAAQLPAGVVTFLPRQEPAIVAAWLRRADISVASVRPGEYGFAFPSKIYAAAACGAPVVYAGSGPARTLVREAKLGAAVPYDPRAVAVAIKAALSQTARPEDRERRATWAATHASLRETGRRAARGSLRTVTAR
ncbi:glycosyltransferase [Georgenia sp. SYP-B2076]|uniref:glycosyltransferase n=1 Tax=Georgenia sp. SYP-B2076 TaxID=2495881 RepID=UPI001F0BAA8E|nr:glycosyltransferase [Georgenia sp. SYP-B2076]